MKMKLIFFKTFFQEIVFEIKKTPLLGSILFLLLSIPAPIFINNVAICLFIILAVIYFRKENFVFEKTLVLPIILYFIMLFSVFWSIDISRTLEALLKESPLLLIPVCFLILKNLTEDEKLTLIKYYSFGIFLYSLYYIINASFKFLDTKDINVFFKHNLVTKLINAIHVSIYVAVAFFYFFTRINKTHIDYLTMSFLILMLLLLGSINTIIVVIFLMIIYHLFFSKLSKQMRLKNIILVILFLISFSFIGTIKERLKVEYETIMTDSTVNDVISKNEKIIYNVSIKQAWKNKIFQDNDYFPGTAFRVYQLRIFLELLQENNIFWQGFGLNASYNKIEEKGILYNVYLGDGTKNMEGYQKKNFHNQYVQNFADLGIFGFLLLIIMLIINLKNGIKTKNFVHISFAILMISLFLTESFLWRQRGVMFFTIMYCIFNTQVSIKLSKI